MNKNNEFIKPNAILLNKTILEYTRKVEPKRLVYTDAATGEFIPVLLISSATEEIKSLRKANVTSDSVVCQVQSLRFPECF